MKTMIALLILTMFVLSGCVTTQKACPPEDAIFYIYTPMGLMPVKVEKDYFNEKGKGEYWMSADEYNKRMEQEEDPEEKNTNIEKL